MDFYCGSPSPRFPTPHLHMAGSFAVVGLILRTPPPPPAFGLPLRFAVLFTHTHTRLRFFCGFALFRTELYTQRLVFLPTPAPLPAFTFTLRRAAHYHHTTTHTHCAAVGPHPLPRALLRTRVRAYPHHYPHYLRRFGSGLVWFPTVAFTCMPPLPTLPLPLPADGWFVSSLRVWLVLVWLFSFCALTYLCMRCARAHALRPGFPTRTVRSVFGYRHTRHWFVPLRAFWTDTFAGGLHFCLYFSTSLAPPLVPIHCFIPLLPPFLPPPSWFLGQDRQDRRAGRGRLVPPRQADRRDRLPHLRRTHTPTFTCHPHPHTHVCCLVPPPPPHHHHTPTTPLHTTPPPPPPPHPTHLPHTPPTTPPLPTPTLLLYLFMPCTIHFCGGLLHMAFCRHFSPARALPVCACTGRMHTHTTAPLPTARPDGFGFFAFYFCVCAFCARTVVRAACCAWMDGVSLPLF